LIFDDGHVTNKKLESSPGYILNKRQSSVSRPCQQHVKLFKRRAGKCWMFVCCCKGC